MFLQSATTFDLQGIPSGKAGTYVTLRKMSSITKAYKKSLPIYLISRNIVQNVLGKDFVGELRAIQQWVQDNIRYTRDIRGVESIQTPVKTLEIRQGDCDDQSVLVASILESLGHKTRFVAMGFQPDKFSHVFTQARIGSKNGPVWLSIETTEPVDIGWKPPRITTKMVVNN